MPQTSSSVAVSAPRRRFAQSESGFLCRLARDRKKTVWTRKEAVMELAQRGHGGLAPLLRQLSGDPDASIRLLSIARMALDDAVAVERLARRLLSDLDPLVRELAAHRLAIVGREGSVPSLQKRRWDENPGVRREISLALESIARRNAETALLGPPQPGSSLENLPA